MIYKCIELFNLLAITPLYKWCIAADWLEEVGLDITASVFREGIFVLEVNEIDDCDYNKVVCGEGRDFANGRGFGDTYAFGHGDGDGNVNGNGRGNGHGSGGGSRSGTGRGAGYGFGHGDGDGHGIG